MTDEDDGGAIRREFDTDAKHPEVAVAEAVADIEERDVTDLETLYERVGNALDGLFSTPPAPEAGMAVSFTYEGYRVTIEQNGSAEFVRSG